MRLLSAKGRGFRKLRKTFEVKFGKLNVIFGENYMGKSSLMTLLSFPLMSQKVFEKKLKIENYISNGEEKFDIEKYVFTAKDYEYIYSCSYGRNNKSNKTLIINNLQGELIETINGVTKVDTRLEEVLGSPELIFVTNMAAQQSEKDFLFLDKGEKLKYLKTLLRIDDVDESIKFLRKAVKDANTQIDTAKAEINILSAQEFKLEEVPEKPQDYDDIINTYAKLKDENEKVEKIKTELIEHETNISRLKDKKDEIVTLTNSNVGLTNLINEKKNELTQFETLDSDLKITNDSIKVLESDKQALEYKKKETENYLTESRNIKVQQRDLTITENSLNSLRFKMVAGIQAEKEVIKELIFSKSNQLNTLIDQVAEIKANIKDKTNHLGLSKQGVCPTCKTEIKLNESDIQKISQEINESEQTLKGLNDLKVVLENAVKGLNSDIEVLNKNEIDLNILLNKIDTLKKGIEEKKAQIKKPEFETTDEIALQLIKIETQLTDLNSQKKELDKKAESLKILKESVIEINSSININSNKLLELSTQIKTIEDLLKGKDITLLKNVVDGFDKKLFMDITTKKNSYDILMNTIENSIKRNIEINKQIDARDRAILEKTSNIKLLTTNIARDEASIDLMQKYSIQKVTTELNKMIKRINSFLIDAHDSCEVKLQDEDGIELVYSLDNGEYWNLIYAASGYERKALVGAWKSALAHMNDLGVLFLDEPDDAAKDEVNSKRLINCFLKQGFDQIFIITHREETINYLAQEQGAILIKVDKGQVFNVN